MANNKKFIKLNKFLFFLGPAHTFILSYPIYINNKILMDYLINNLETCYYDVSSLDE